MRHKGPTSWSRWLRTGALGLVVAACAPPYDNVAVGPPQITIRPDPSATAAFDARLADYVALYQRLKRTMAPLPEGAPPDRVHAFELGLERLIASARSGQEEGDTFVPEIQAAIRRISEEVFAGPYGQTLVAEIREESAERRRRARVNERYPDDMPVSSMPYLLLQALPILPEELEYRFLGGDLILLDVHSRLVVDVMRDLLPQ